jgi:3-deoxy-D-manno-octulosonic-acid transferase
MWKLIYNILTLCALPFLILAGLTNAKMKPNFRRRLIPPREDIPAGALMIHGASIGEAVIARNLADYLSSRGSPHHFLITANTYYAEEMLKKKPAQGYDLRCEALPFDLHFSVCRFLDHFKPSSIIVVETEIWPNLVWEARKRNIPFVIVNGRISDRTLKTYQRLSIFMRSVFNSMDSVIAQSTEHRERFISIGMAPERIFVTGNVKYYRPAVEGVTNKAGADTVITFGSVKEKELEEVYLAIALLKQTFPGSRYFIAPRELHLAENIETELSGKYSTVRYTRIKGKADNRADIVVVDTVGDLQDIYGHSAVAFVGGSLAPYGGQNMLEPLFVGTPVLFGPFTDTFRDIAQAILDNKAGFLVRTGKEIHDTIVRLLQDTGFYSAAQKAGKDIVAQQAHVMQETAEIILKRLETARSGRRA